LPATSSTRILNLRFLQSTIFYDVANYTSGRPWAAAEGDLAAAEGERAAAAAAATAATARATDATTRTQRATAGPYLAQALLQASLANLTRVK
jgi:hypothetical protein